MPAEYSAFYPSVLAEKEMGVLETFYGDPFQYLERMEGFHGHDPLNSVDS